MRSFLGKLSTVEESDLTSREIQLVNYIKNNMNEIVAKEMKIEQLAQAVGTGYSAIYGLLKKINIKGYKDFTISLSNDVDNASIHDLNSDENVANGYINLIKQNYAVIEKKKIIKTVDIIKSSPRIFVSYWESTLKGPANDLSNFFFEKRMNVILLDSDWDTINRRVDAIVKGDLFIFFTKYGTSKHLEKLVLMIKEKKGEVIFISGRVPSNSIENSASSIHTLIVDGIENGLQNINISKTLPFHYFNDLLIYYYENYNKKK
ncbi:MurR/RpiR family transcriptional regulator [Mesoplasma photuris]|uniref:MurR/RpiR family transcriptional regulator n=1 Tax=Mesoplasma photuris TaxID=217731 RepID=UPI0004E284C5|nr:MurR/RpiR family transcriptional regulator [Mesoplasma photuris]